MRALVMLAVLMFASFGARAEYCGIPTLAEATTAAGPNVTYPTREAAQAACESVPQVVTIQSGWGGGWFDKHNRSKCKLNETSKSFSFTTKSFEFNNAGDCNMPRAPDGPDNGAAGWHFTGEICPAGTTWDPVNQKCFNRDRCLDKSALGNGLIGASATSGCIDGCEFAPPDGGTTLTFNGSQFVTMSKGWTPTGNACSVDAPTPNQEDPQICKDLGDGQTACVKQDGQQCYKGPIGTAMQFCWGPSEVGDKNQDNVRQKRNAGETPVAPNVQLPSGDNLQQQGPPIKTQVTNNNTTTTTTTTNYTTQHGTDANGGGKPSNDGEPGDGSGKPDDGDGDGTASGGADCKSPPIVTGDQVLGMVANQAWQTRCAVEAGNSVKVTGDVGDCASPFTVEGTTAQAQQLRAMRAQICKGDENGDGQPDWTKPDGTEAGEGGGDDDEPGIMQRMVNTDMLDSGGFFGGGACPQLGTIDLGYFGSFSFDSEPWFCDLVALMRGVVLLLGAFISLRILTGEGL